MLQTSSISSSIPWNDAVYSNWSPILTLILLIIRITVVIAQRKYYSQPVVVILFLTVKIFMDYFMFEGVERFSSFPENINLRIVCAIEVFYVIMSNFIIYSTFYGDFKLPIKVIIQFSALNLISVIVAMVLLIVIENPMCYLTTVVALHVISMILFREKCVAFMKCGTYNAFGKLFIYFTMLFKFFFDHFIRIFYIGNLLFNLFDPSLIRDTLLFFIQIFSTCILLFFYIFYRRQNSDRIGTFFAAEKKIGEKTKSQRSAESNFVFENAAEELMFPGENELNTISDIASEDECDLNLDDEIEIAQQEEAIVSAPASSREPSIFATAESGRPRRHEHRIQIMQRTLNRVASIECYHPSTIER
ncbi:hypothetical protein L5515_008876 [Caenorhabditis briggsae]|uniref:Uncharacterized protein n=1 Tax=Caenorhabditis briggsae TaxID=6238 RepID=A0AAE9JN07_CAEBR|nr:hypothetical protein L5515_008876 [Caenorhabditis briggsae]